MTLFDIFSVWLIRLRDDSNILFIFLSLQIRAVNLTDQIIMGCFNTGLMPPCGGAVSCLVRLTRVGWLCTAMRLNVYCWVYFNFFSSVWLHTDTCYNVFHQQNGSVYTVYTCVYLWIYTWFPLFWFSSCLYDVYVVFQEVHVAVSRVCMTFDGEI